MIENKLHPGIGIVITRMTSHYRSQYVKFIRIGNKYISSPTHAVELEIAEQRGYCKGVKKCIDYFEEASIDNEFNFKGES